MKKIINHLKENWIKYGFETFVITIGILGAFFLNNWNENKKARIEEQIVLMQLKSEFEENLEQLNKKIQIRRDIISNGKWILVHLDRRLVPNEDSLYLAINKTYFTPTFDPITSDVAGGNDLHLIRNRELKHLLSIWTSEIVQVTEEEVGWDKFVDEHYMPFLIDKINFREIVSLSLSNNAAASYLLNAENAAIDIGRSSYKTDPWTVLSKEQDFEDFIGRAIQQAHTINIQSQSMHQRIQQILDLIILELDS